MRRTSVEEGKGEKAAVLPCRRTRTSTHSLKRYVATVAAESGARSLDLPLCRWDVGGC